MSHAAESAPHPPAGFVILDRDGTINVERHYLSDPDQLELLPGAIEGLQRMQALGLSLIVATNQSGIPRGYFDEPQLHRIHDRLQELLTAEGVTLTAVYYSADHPDADSPRRKPAPGMLLEAAADFDFDPASAFVIGDKASDIGLGRNVDATTILVRTGYGTQTEQQQTCRPDHVVDDLIAAAGVIAAALAERKAP